MTELKPDNTIIDGITNFVEEGLKKTRIKLLDVSARNRLLNFKHSASKILRLVDELPDQIYSKLVSDSDGASLLLVPVPLPKKTDYPGIKDIKEIDSKVHAKKLGIDTNWEMPIVESEHDSRHQDNKLQTLLYPESLDRLARRIQSEARTAIEESGVNMLFLCLGFLKWSDHEDSGVFYSSPLIMIPIQIERDKVDVRTGYAKFRIQYTGEDILDNICLREKLKQLAIELPPFENFETPDSYFSALAELLKDIKPTWEINRFLTISFLSFGKMLMYLDLDPAKWPDNEAINKVPHIMDIFNGNYSEEGNSADEFDIDADTKLPYIAHVMDADSSQHSAIIDVLNGKNLVIEGPPGTGKSQTITNLIAACLLEGKTVLFVAEKLAALEVVRRRLDSVGLGDFCLELHSHKTQKKALINDLKKRLELNSSKYSKAASEVENSLSELNAKKTKLIEYSKAVNTPFSKLGETPHEIFWKTEVFQKRLSQNYNVENFSIIESVIELSKNDIKQKLEIIKNLADNLKDYFSSNFVSKDHYWQGLSISGPVSFPVQQSIFNLLKQLSINAGTSKLEIENLYRFNLKQPNISQYKLLSNGLLNFTIDDFKDAHLYGILDENEIYEGLESCHNLLMAYQKYLEIYVIKLEEFGLKSEQIEKIININFEKTNVTNSLAIDNVNSNLSNLNFAILDYKKAQETINEAVQYLNINGDNIVSIEAVFIVSRLCESINKNILIYRSPVIENSFDNPDIQEVIKIATALQSDRVKLNSQFDLNSLTSLGRLKEIHKKISTANIFSFLSPDWRLAIKDYKRMSLGLVENKSSLKPKQIAIEIKKLIDYIELKEDFEKNSVYNSLLPGIFKGINTDVDSLKSIVDFYAKLHNEILSIPNFGTKIYTSLISQEKHVFEWFTQQKNIFLKAEGTLKAIKDLYSAVALDFGQNEDSILLLLRNSEQFIEEFKKLHNQLKQAEISTTLTIDNIKEIVACRLLFSSSKNDFINNRIIQKFKFTEDSENIKEQLSTLNNLIVTVAKTKKYVPVEARAFILNSDGYKNILQINKSADKVGEFLDIENTLKNLLNNQADLTALWDTRGSHESYIHSVYDKLKSIESENESFIKWCEVINNLADVKEAGLEKLIRDFINSNQPQVPFFDYILLFEYLTYHNLCNEALRHNDILGTFSRITHENIRASFRSIDLELQKLNSKKIAFEISRRYIPVGLNIERSPKNYGDLRLIKHEIGKQKAHLPIRKLVAQSYNALVAMKPCFMMGPLSVAQYLAPSHRKFDVLIMDEASQVKPEDAIGVLARAKQVVVVGDSNQLPPTGFFDVLGADNDNIEDEEVSAIQDSESILDVCKPLFQPLRRLRWHYRSRHQSLISFSNHHFYENDLVIFPSPTANSEIIGVKHVFVSDGVYGSQSNLIEARKVVEDIVEMTKKYPSISYGIVSLNAKQKMIIEDELERVRKDDPVFNEFYDSSMSTNEPFFVKNLENVQGDERDVIFISCTFGLDENGVFRQNFGPINGKNGWRRLNVLFTRAKQHVRIFSSFNPERIKVDDSKEQRGLRALKDYLHFAATGVDNHSYTTKKEPDSDFERAVGAFLTKHGYEVIYQLGVAGYLIDLVVRHPKQPSNYVIAIECDGATYHSARSARDRDRLREENLRKLGWSHIHRIWSTDWFKRREQEEIRLLKAVETAINSY